ncbi:MAG TPA: hypothetical protein VM939_06560 [Gemmatimonadaceae bacterium]|nr:hypothetical protein [Gemmatimonadaceae bacterium]
MFSIRSAAIRTLAVGLAVIAIGCGKKDDATQIDPGTSTSGNLPAPTPSATAIRVSEIEVGKGLNADKTLGDATNDFGVRDTVYVVVKTDGAATAAKLDAKWTFQSGQTVSESSQTISPTGGEARHEFHLQKASAWPKGDYKVEILLDGVSAGTKDFNIK